LIIEKCFAPKDIAPIKIKGRTTPRIIKIFFMYRFFVNPKWLKTRYIKYSQKNIIKGIRIKKNKYLICINYSLLCLIDLYKKKPMIIKVTRGETRDGISTPKESASIMIPNTKTEYIAPFFK